MSQSHQELPVGGVQAVDQVGPLAAGSVAGDSPDLLVFVKQNGTALDSVQVYCSEVRARDGNIEHRFDVARRLEVMMESMGIRNSEAFVKELGRNSRTFHDRELSFECADATGCEVTHRYFLTGGIDYLLDTRSDTKVFHTRLEG